MRSIFVLAGAGCAALLSACASAPAPAQTANVGPNGEPLICRSMKVTGTRFAEKTCKSAEAWAAYDKYTNENAKESTDKIQRLNTGAAANAGG